MSKAAMTDQLQQAVLKATDNIAKHAVSVSPAIHLMLCPKLIPLSGCRESSMSL